MDRQSMPQSPDAPERMAGMVPGVRAGGFLFLSAIRGRDPATNRMPDDPYEQACQALRNVQAVLAASGATLQHVVKVTLYLHDLDQRKGFHQAWMEFFPKDPPARIAVGVADANGAPGGNAHYALDVIALAP
ncbi:MAG: hypothetical protein ABS43_31500 [Bordetella sp. SCN 67-23]|nr:RidA family protein [Burkholderiales bacterium]ODS65668.1 MAG: hypothetical protein ABS43_31500 [Bordetella sp. SCN 67-23]OJW92078.1 MAG: hypothetical protein BGO71_06060 [Burkholderiales bacterium 67-32]